LEKDLEDLPGLLEERERINKEHSKAGDLGNPNEEALGLKLEKLDQKIERTKSRIENAKSKSE